MIGLIVFALIMGYFIHDWMKHKDIQRKEEKEADQYFKSIFGD